MTYGFKILSTHSLSPPPNGAADPWGVECDLFELSGKTRRTTAGDDDDRVFVTKNTIPRGRGHLGRVLTEIYFIGVTPRPSPRALTRTPPWELPARTHTHTHEKRHSDRSDKTNYDRVVILRPAHKTYYYVVLGYTHTRTHTRAHDVMHSCIE